MKNIEFARDFIKVCDYKGYFHGKTYYIDKTKQGYVATLRGCNGTQFNARTLKDLSNQLLKVTK
jgi:hypothetical protein